jgi:hypothetical protein
MMIDKMDALKIYSMIETGCAFNIFMADQIIALGWFSKLLALLKPKSKGTSRWISQSCIAHRFQQSQKASETTIM